MFRIAYDLTVITMASIGRLVRAELASRLSDRTAPRVAAGVAFAFFIAVRLTSMSPLTGDEPHYLILTQSVLTDRDFKVANNYARFDHRAYAPRELEPHLVGGEDPRIRRYSLHAPGLALIIAPAFAVAGAWGAIVFLAAVAALGTAFVWSAGYLLTRDPVAAWFGWALITMTSPMALFASLIYPDPVAGTLIAIGVWAIIRSATKQFVEAGTGPASSTPGVCTWSTGMSFGVGVAIALLPWLHTRLAIPAALLAAVLVLRLASFDRTGTRLLLMFLLPLIVSLGLWLTYFQVLYGSMDPRSSLGGQTPINRAYIINGLAGMFADQEFGLLPNAPAYLIAFSGLGLLWRRDRRLAAEVALITTPYVVAASGYPMWWAGACPPARFLLPVLLPFGATAALVWAGSRRNGRLVALVMLGASVAIASIMAFAQDGALAYNDADGSARWLDWLTADTVATRTLPSFFRGFPAATPAVDIRWNLVLPAVFWGALGALLIAIARRRDR